MYNKVEICGVNTAKLKVLSNEEKLELLKKAKAGDKQAREDLINGNLRLVLSVIQSFQNRGENPDDLFQVGCIGLIKAVDNFDMNLDVKFSTYAVPMILGEVRRYLRDNNMVRVSRSLRDLAYKALQAKEKLSVSLSREPTVEEIANEIGETPQNVTNALDAIVDPVSLYDPVYSDSGDSIYVLDQISDTTCTDETWLNNIAISEAIKKLGERERRILLLRFYSGKTQTEVSEEIGISQAQVSRLEKHALEKIKKQM
ncbi:MAG TPA: RNA polymerase sporulation sigma factor SigG [Bacillota bacterium]|nr:RNA polymerase sporulation sigma factor SigG [Bacillota bacterium]HOK69088.1 RNA polymerase sporulation sigma factor SigG [Bacillota bacterium]HPP84642.1 RNA polymerase sporulation sigma factor SigG [Bacillota bacterium]